MTHRASRERAGVSGLLGETAGDGETQHGKRAFGCCCVSEWVVGGLTWFVGGVRDLAMPGQDGQVCVCCLKSSKYSNSSKPDRQIVNLAGKPEAKAWQVHV